MKKTKFLSLLSVLALLGGLFSCNSASSGNSASTGPVQIEFWHTFGKEITDAIKSAADDFTALVKEKEGVDVQINMTYQGGYDDILDKINKGFPTGNYPNLSVAYPDHVASYLKAEGRDYGKYVVDLSRYIDSEEYGFGKEEYLGDGPASDFVDVFYQEGQCYGRKGVYSLPLMKSSEVLFYNKNTVEPLAMQYDPSLKTSAQIEQYFSDISFDKLMDFCKFIKPKLSSDKVPFIYDSDSNLFISKCYQNKIDFLSVDSDGKGQVLFNNDKAKAMVKKLKGYVDEGLLKTKGMTGEYASNAFKNEQCIFTVGSTGGSGYNVPTGEAFRVGVAPVPYDNDNPLYVTQGVTATVLKSNDPDGRKALYSYKFLKYLTGAEVNAELCVNGSNGYSPVRKSAYTTTMYSDYLASAADEEVDIRPTVAKVVYEDINEKYFNTPCFSGSAKAREVVGGILTQVFISKDADVDSLIDRQFKEAENTAKLAM